MASGPELKAFTHLSHYSTNTLSKCVTCGKGLFQNRHLTEGWFCLCEKFTAEHVEIGRRICFRITLDQVYRSTLGLQMVQEFGDSLRRGEPVVSTTAHLDWILTWTGGGAPPSTTPKPFGEQRVDFGPPALFQAARAGRPFLGPTPLQILRSQAQAEAMRQQRAASKARKSSVPPKGKGGGKGKGKGKVSQQYKDPWAYPPWYSGDGANQPQQESWSSYDDYYEYSQGGGGQGQAQSQASGSNIGPLVQQEANRQLAAAFGHPSSQGQATGSSFTPLSVSSSAETSDFVASGAPGFAAPASPEANPDVEMRTAQKRSGQIFEEAEQEEQEENYCPYESASQVEQSPQYYWPGQNSQVELVGGPNLVKE